MPIWSLPPPTPAIIRPHQTSPIEDSTNDFTNDSTPDFNDGMSFILDPSGQVQIIHCPPSSGFCYLNGE